MLVGKPEGKRQPGKPGRKWVNIKMEFKNRMGVDLSDLGEVQLSG
jgi:hypothetical protein